MKRSSTHFALAAALAAPGLSAQTLEQKVDVLQQEVESLKMQSGTASSRAPSAGRDPQRRDGSTTLTAYGEAAYSKFRESGDASADQGRFVFGLGHRFDERLSFHSEVELEHAVVSADDEGEVEVEQAWLNYRQHDGLNVKAGLFLIPLGILNETHEPPTYYGVQRNLVETRVIPTTWRELGVGAHGLIWDGVRYDAGVTTGFDLGKLDDPTTGIRSAHQEGQKANARNLAVYGALNYSMPGLRLGGGVFTGNTGQNGASNPALSGVGARFTIWDVHAQYRVGPLDCQALYVAGTLRDAEKVTAALFASDPATAFAAPKSMKGAYAQLAYHIVQQSNVDIAPFLRYERIDIRQAEDPANGLLRDPNNDERVKVAGVNVWPHPRVVLKADVQRYTTDKTQDRFDLGLGFMF